MFLIIFIISSINIGISFIVRDYVVFIRAIVVIVIIDVKIFN